MPEQTIYRKTTSHFDNDNDPIPEFNDGIDTHTFAVPEGQQFTRYSVTALPGSTPLLAAYQVIKAPRRGATGQQSVRLRWHYLPFGKIRYRIVASAAALNTSTTPLIILVGVDNWVEDAIQAVDQRLAFRLVVRGPDVAKLHDLLRPHFPKPIAPVGPTIILDPVITPTVLITGIICLAILGIAGLAVLCPVLLYAISEGFGAKTHGKLRNELLGEAEIGFDLTPPPDTSPQPQD